MAEPKRRKLLGEILKEMKKVTQGQIQEALSVQREKGGQIGGILIQLKFIENSDLVKALALQSEMEIVDLAAVTIPAAVLARVDAQTAQAFRVVPFKEEAGTLHVALA